MFNNQNKTRKVNWAMGEVCEDEDSEFGVPYGIILFNNGEY